MVRNRALRVDGMNTVRISCPFSRYARLEAFYQKIQAIANCRAGTAAGGSDTTEGGGGGGEGLGSGLRSTFGGNTGGSNEGPDTVRVRTTAVDKVDVGETDNE